MKKIQLLSIIMIVLSIGYRLFGTVPNFSPIMAVALFSGLTLENKKIALGVPLGIMLITDVILAYTQTWTSFWGYMSFQPIVYISLIAVVLIGGAIKNKNILTIGASVVGGSLLFFIITNLFVWLDFSGFMMYPKTFSGLVQCYTMAIPFYKMSIISDVLFSGLLYGLYYGVALNVPVFRKNLAVV